MDWHKLKELLEEAMEELMGLGADPQIVQDFNRAYAFTNCVTKHKERLHGRTTQ